MILAVIQGHIWFLATVLTMETDRFASLTSSLKNEEELGGLLSQHLSELDESLAALTEAGRVREQSHSSSSRSAPKNFLAQRPQLEDGRVQPSMIESLPPPRAPPRQFSLEPKLQQTVPCCGNSQSVKGYYASHVQRCENKGLGHKENSSQRGTETRLGDGSEGMLESLLRGIETQQLSINDALRNLERLPTPEASSSNQTHQSPESVKQHPLVAPCNRCSQCPILGLQVRALAQSLSGLGASVVKWSSCLVHSRQSEINDMVLEYVQPLKHLDAQLETLCSELTGLTGDLNSLADLAGSNVTLETQLDQRGLRQTWRSEAGNSPLSSVLRSPQFLAMNISMDAMRPEEPEHRNSCDTLSFPELAPPAWPGQISMLERSDTGHTRHPLSRPSPGFGIQKSDDEHH